MDERTASPASQAEEASAALGLSRQEGGEGVDFASRQAERGKMQVWLTAFTAAAAVAVVAVVSVSVIHPN